MPPRIIEAPDGKVIEFPDGMPDSEINIAMGMQYPPSFGDKVGADLSKRAGNIAQEWQPGPSYLGADSETPMESFNRSGGRLLRTAGQMAGGVNDVIGQGLIAGYHGLVPKSVQDYLASKARPAMDAIAPALQSAQGVYGDIKGAFPETVGNVEAVANIAGVVPTGMIGKKAGGLVADAGSIVKGAVTPTKTPEVIDRMIDLAIDKGINKAVRPSVAGKANINQINEYLGKAHNAVKQIAANKGNLVLSGGEDGLKVTGKLPSSLNQFAEAIDQTKKGIFKQYDDMARQAGADGAMVELGSVSKELDRVADGVVLQDLDPLIAKYASDRSKMFSKREAYTAEQAQDAITILNKSLESFYKNPSYENASKAGIDAIIANNLRKSLDNTIEGVAGPGYQELKNAYGSLKTIEKDVAHRAIVDARKNIKGLVDFTDIYTSGELMAGLATMSPGMIVKGLTWKGVQQYIKAMNNPNRIVKTMFGDVDNLIDMKNKVRNP